MQRNSFWSCRDMSHWFEGISQGLAVRNECSVKHDPVAALARDVMWYIYICVYVSVYVYEYVYACVYVYVFVHMYVYVYVLM